MTLQEVLTVLSNNNIKLALEDGDQLKIRAAKGAITPEIKQLLVSNKTALIDWIKASNEKAKLAAPIPSRAAGEPLQLSFAQQRLWFIDQLDPGNVAYNIPAAVKVKGNIRIDILQQAFDEVICRHEVLRTSYHNKAGNAELQIHQDVHCNISIKDYPSEDQSDEALMDVAAAEANQAFDLSKVPLIRVTVFRLTPDASGNETEYLLVLNLHHIITDGWSNGVLMQEIATLYDAFQNGHPSPLEPLSIQYSDYAAWQRNNLGPETLKEKLEFWRQQLADVPVLELPTDRPRPAQRSGKGDQINFPVNAEITGKLNALAKQQGVTLFITLMSAFQTLLHRYTGQTDICVGTPIAGRNRAELQNLIGFFVNTLALRSDLDNDPSFTDLLTHVNARMLEATKNQDVPFENIVETLGLSRDMSTTPIFQVLLALQNAPGATALPDADLSFAPVETKSKSSKFDITVNIREVPVGDGESKLVVALEYNTDLFAKPTIVRLAAHFTNLLKSIAENPQQAISKLNLLSPQEFRLVTEEFNQTAIDYPRSASIASLFEQCAQTHADCVAVDFPEIKLSYRELNARASQLANHLRQQGIGNGARIGICLERSPEMVISMLAILKLGGCYVPIDPNYPEERMVYMLEDVQAPVIISIAEHQQRLQSLNTQLPAILLLDQLASNIAEQSNEFISDANNDNGNRLAYIMYTSGSTGKPKGVMVPERGITRLVRNTNYVDLGPNDGIAHLSNVSFDAATFEIWGALLNGARLVGISKEDLLSPTRLVARIQQGDINTMFITTALFNLYAAESKLAFSKLKYLLFGGEACDPSKIKEVLEHGKPQHLLHMYGPTENTTYSTFFDIQQVPDNALTVPIGGPLANSSVYILDNRGNPAPIGVSGEIYCGGEGISLGYLNRQDLTEKSFLPDPFSKTAGQLMYRTGDIGRFLADGSVEISGRIDDQVKIRGFRIELGEVETVVSQLQGVRECAIVVREDQPGNKYLAAYIIPENTLKADHSNSEINANLRKELRERLPEYMIPTALVLMESLPLNANGKLDRRALPAPNAADMASTEYVAPRNDEEQQIADIFAQVLGLEKVGVLDNFFELGGHSLLATQVVARISEQLNIDLPLKAFFESPSVDKLVARLSHFSDRVALPALSHVDRNGPIPISFAQQRLWIIDKIQPDSPMYNIPFALRIKGNLDTTVLEKVFQEIIRRHDVLRTHFAGSSDDAHQVIADELDWQLPIFDIANDDNAIKQRAGAFLMAPFKLTDAPLMRIQLLKIDNGSNDEYVLLACMHHIISDGWSMDVLFHEIATLYQAFAAGQPSPLAALEFQYADFAAWQRNWLQGETLEQQISYWREQLTAIPVLELPTDHPRPPVLDAQGRIIDFTLPTELSQQLREFSHRQGTTLFMTLLAAFEVLMYRYSGQTDISIGSPIANRRLQALEPMIGFFVNTLVLRNQLHPAASFSELLQAVKSTTLDAYQHQDIPFERLVDELNVPRSLSHTPLFQVMFILQNANQLSGGGSVNLNELQFSTLFDEAEQQAAAKFDITLSVEDNPQQLRGTLEYRSGLFNTATMRRLLNNYQTLLHAIIANPQVAIDSLNLVADDEQQTLLESWNNTEIVNAPLGNVHQLFEKQVQRSPAAIATRCGDQSLMYHELNARANQLANYLIEQGVQAGACIGMCLHPGVDVLVAILGILKARAAYVPMDPNYPDDRLAHMQSNAAMPVIITNQALSARFSGSSALVVTLDTLTDTLANYSKTNLTLDYQADDLLYVVYTSGSTGLPKGAGVRHRNEINLLTWYTREYAMGDSDKALIISALGFDLTQKNLFALLTCGGEVIFPDTERYDHKVISDTIAAQGITLVNCAPSAFYPLVEQSDDLSGLASLRCVLFGGEPIRLEVMRAWLERDDCHCHIVNMYGPTECTDIAASYTISDPGSYDSSIVPIGRPNDNVQLYVLDDRLQTVPVGVVGELCIGGAGVGVGYINNDDMTQAAFVNNPYGDGLLYRSGDLVRYREDGQLIFVARKDGQIKIRGFRIELSEIEAAINRIGGVQESVVTTYEHNDTRFIVAYVVASSDASETNLNITSIRTQLKQSLPDYMVPACLLPIAEIPLSANGKVDRKALPAPDPSNFSSAPYVAPETDVEKKLAPLWSQVLQLSKVGRHDNFFECGGHSLLAIKLAAAIETEFNVEIPLSSLFEMSTLEDMAAFIESTLWARQDYSDQSTEQQPGLDADREEFEL